MLLKLYRPTVRKGIILTMLLNGNEKKEGKGSLRKRKCWAHRVQTKYSLVHLICTAILCAYICGLLWTHSYYNLHGSWNLSKQKVFLFLFFFNQRYCNAFRFLFFASLFFNFKGLWKTGKKKGWFFSILGKEGRLQHQHRQCSKDNFEEDQTTTTTTH